MKKILFLTDTHGCKQKIEKLDSQMQEVDYIFFAGDNFKDLDFCMNKFGKKIYRVKGNCDFFSREDEELLINVDGAKFLLCHGDKYGVKFSLLRLKLRAVELGANAVCFGHTHIKTVKNYDGITLINAGALSSANGTYAIITVNDGIIRAEIKDI